MKARIKKKIEKKLSKFLEVHRLFHLVYTPERFKLTSGVARGVSQTINKVYKYR